MAHQTTLPGTILPYDWDAQYALQTRIELLKKIHATLRRPESKSGELFLRKIFQSAGQFEEIQRQHKLVQSANAHASLSKDRIVDLVDYVENLILRFPNTEMVRREVIACGNEIRAIMLDMNKTRMIYGSKHPPYFDSSRWRECHDVAILAENKYANLKGEHTIAADSSLHDTNPRATLHKLSFASFDLANESLKSAAAMTEIAENTLAVMWHLINVPDDELVMNAGRIKDLDNVIAHTLLVTGLNLEDAGVSRRRAYTIGEIYGPKDLSP